MFPVATTSQPLRVRKRHQDRATDPGLEVLGREALETLERVVVRAHDRLDRDLAEVDAEVLAHLACVVAGVGRREPRWHRRRVDVLGAERVDGDRGGERRVDAAADPEHDVAEPVLGDVVAEPEPEREPHLLELALERDDCRRHGVTDGLGVGQVEDPRRRDGDPGTLELASAHVAQPTTHCFGRIEVDNEQRLLEPGSPRDHLALVVEHDRVTVEDELVLAADEVAEGEVGGVVARPRDQHLLAILGLADVERRRRRVDDERRPGQREVGRRWARLPDVLADGRADEDVSRAEHQQISPFGEVAVLVEDPVVGEKVLAVDRLHAPVEAHRGSVEEVALEDRAADERGHAHARLRDLVERLARGADETRAEEQILGRVPGHRQLGEKHELGCRLLALGDRLDDALDVAVERADGDVELGKRESHRRVPKRPCFGFVHSIGVPSSSFVIRRRFRGPLQSGNGGYVAGRLANELGGVVEVTLRRPPALDRPLRLERTDEGLELFDADVLVAQARVASVELEPPGAPSFAEAEAAPEAPPWWGTEEYGECFSCGVRAEGDGLAIHPRPFDGFVAAPWRATDVSPEIVWAAIDCSGAYAVGGPGRGEPLLARMTARIDRLPTEGEGCVVVGWSIEEDGRKLHAGTALYGVDGAPIAVSRQLWIVPATL